MPESVLINFASTHGHTEKICEALKEVLEEQGFDVTMTDVRKDNEARPSEFNAVVVAASIHRGQHQVEMVEWVDRHIVELVGRPNAFLSVSLSAADQSDEAKEDARLCTERFVRETGWRPQRTEAIAGALQYREYDPFTRILMKLLMKHQDHPTDTSRDFVYTDWEGLRRIGRELALEFSGTEVN